MIFKTIPQSPSAPAPLAQGSLRSGGISKRQMPLLPRLRGRRYLTGGFLKRKRKRGALPFSGPDQPNISSSISTILNFTLYLVFPPSVMALYCSSVKPAAIKVSSLFVDNGSIFLVTSTSSFPT